MNNDVSHTRHMRSLSYMLLLPVLALSVCLQFIILALVPQGFLAALISLFKAPGYASYPYNISMQVTLSSSPAILYASTVPDSFALRTSDGVAVQKVPERLFAAYKGILYTLTYTPDPQGGSTLLRALRAGDGKLLWSYTLENLQGTQLIDGILYLNKDEAQKPGLLQALNPANGRLLWQYQCPDQQCYVSMPQVLNGIAYTKVQETANTLLALRTSDGSPLWRVSQGQFGSPPIITPDRIIVQTSVDTFTAFNATDGRLLWQRRPEPGINTSWLRATANGSIGLIQTSTTVYAFRLDSGTPLWLWQGRPIDIKLTDTAAYLATPPSFVALRIATGQEMWRQTYSPAAGTIVEGTPPYQGNTILGEFNGMVYVQTRGIQNNLATDTFIAYRVVDGRLAWQHHIEESIGPGNTPPPGGQTLVAGSAFAALLNDGTVYGTYHLAVTDVPPSHFTLSVNQALSSPFHTTTFTLTTLAIDGLTGSVKWQNQQVEMFQVA